MAGRGDLGRAEAVSGRAPTPLLLASTSPQRSVILSQLGIPFDVARPRYDEKDVLGADPIELVRAHALGKARSLAGEAANRPVLGIDTTVLLDEQVFGKPADENEPRSRRPACRRPARPAELSCQCPGRDDLPLHRPASAPYRGHARAPVRSDRPRGRPSRRSGAARRRTGFPAG